jgi:hypothetical protein
MLNTFFLIAHSVAAQLAHRQNNFFDETTLQEPFFFFFHAIKAPIAIKGMTKVVGWLAH